MDRNEQKIVIASEDILSTIARVNIKIDDRDSVEIMLEKGILGPNGNIIQDTETLRLDIACAATSAAMMAWRPHSANGILVTALHDQIDSFHYCACRIEGCIP